MVVQNVSAGGKETDLTFTIKLDDLKKTQKLVENNKQIKFKKLIINKNVSKVSIVGVGMITTPGITYRMFKALSKKKINIEVISTSEIKISVLINKKNLKKSVEILHQEFKLNTVYEFKTIQRYKKKKTKEIKVGTVKIGGNNPISVQSMTNTLTTDVKQQLNRLKVLQMKVLILLEFHVLMKILLNL